MDVHSYSFFNSCYLLFVPSNRYILPKYISTMTDERNEYFLYRFFLLSNYDFPKMTKTRTTDNADQSFISALIFKFVALANEHMGISDYLFLSKHCGQILVNTWLQL